MTKRPGSVGGWEKLAGPPANGSLALLAGNACPFHCKMLAIENIAHTR